MLQSPNAGQKLPPINEESEEDILRTQELLKKDCTNSISSTPCSTPNLSQDYSSLLDDEFLKDDFDESTGTNIKLKF
uniref:Uncharacterized protein n=1 Tax=Romanomermis culicivorax TaxID=13658 RepID=A0A915IHV2_ROMCU